MSAPLAPPEARQQQAAVGIPIGIECQLVIGDAIGLLLCASSATRDHHRRFRDAELPASENAAVAGDDVAGLIDQHPDVIASKRQFRTGLSPSNASRIFCRFSTGGSDRIKSIPSWPRRADNVSAPIFNTVV